VIEGEIFDVAVDLRRSSKTFGKWVGEVLSAKNKKQLWIPEGFAHGFLVLSDVAEVLYKATEFYAPKSERVLIWNDPSIGITWPFIFTMPKLSMKDVAGILFHNTEYFN
jgi:dTDP-4-dehydrorhamnose 3,5-epimerase